MESKTMQTWSEVDLKDRLDEVCNRAESLTIEGYRDGEILELEALLSRVPKDIDPEKRARALQVRGYVCKALKRFDDSESSLKRAFDLWNQLGNSTEQLGCCNILLGLSEHIGRKDEAIYYATQAAKICREFDEVIFHARARYYDARRKMIGFADYPSAEKDLTEALQILDNCDSVPRTFMSQCLSEAPGYRAICLQRLEVICLGKGEFDKVEEMVKSILAYARWRGKITEEANSIAALGELDLFRQNYESAVEYALEALRKAEVVSEKQLILQSRAILACGLAHQGDLEEARMHAEYVVESDWFDLIPPARPVVLNYVGRVFEMCSDRKRATRAYEMAIVPTGSLKEQEKYVIAQLDTGRFFLRDGQIERGLALLKEAADAFSKMGAVFFEAKARAAIARGESGQPIVSQPATKPMLVGNSKQMRELRQQIDKAAARDFTVLIQGETGVGKDLVARSIHQISDRASKPYLAVNCAALPSDLLMSELFGHARGAFTGANASRAGMFEAADGGTILLDEIGDASPQFQVSLLRVLQDGEIRRIGETMPRSVDVRVIAASNRDIESLVEQGIFRADLLYRLQVFEIDVPPLIARIEDLPDLVTHIIARVSGDDPVSSVDDGVIDALMQYDWPGNVRELENEVTRAIAGTPPGAPITPEALSRTFKDFAEFANESNLKSRVDAYERAQIIRVLDQCDGNITKAADRLGLTRYGLYKKLDRHGLRR